MALCAQQRRSCTMILCTGRLWARAGAGAVGVGGFGCAIASYLRGGLCTSWLWARARAGVLVLAVVHEGVRPDADAAEDGNVDEDGIGRRARVYHSQVVRIVATQRGTTRLRRRASASVTSAVNG